MTKRGDTMLIAQLEDMLGSIEVTVFPRAYEASADVWREEAVLLVTGQVKLREEEPQVVCDTVEVFALSEEDVTRRDYHLRITLQRTRNEPLDVAYAQDVAPRWSSSPATTPGSCSCATGAGSRSWPRRRGRTACATVRSCTSSSRASLVQAASRRWCASQ